MNKEELHLALRVPLQDAQQVKDHLLKKGLLLRHVRSVRDDSFLYLALAAPAQVGTLICVEHAFPVSEKKNTFRDALLTMLTREEYDVAVKGFDSLGSIAIIEIPHELEHKEHAIAQALLETNPAIKTVLKKEGAHTGEFRTQHCVYLAGAHTKTATYLEHGLTFCFDVEQVYFSVRLSQERKRIASCIEEGEEVLVFFSGCGPYPLVLARHSKAKHITGVELNPYGHAAAEENKKRNAIRNVSFFCADANNIQSITSKKFDRIIMPSPKNAADYLDSALAVAKPRATIHFYDFEQDTAFALAGLKVQEACARNNRHGDILRIVACGEHSPHVYRVCVDAKIRRA